jgi:hypothetical protein
MEAILQRGEAAPSPHKPLQASGSRLAALRRWIVGRLDALVPPPASPRETPPELFRYPLP